MELKTKNAAIDLSALPSRLATVLASAYEQKFRIRLWYGDTKTGLAWNEFYDVMGTVGASTGISPCLILVPTARSLGGGSILTDRIVRVDCISDRRTLYKHENFHVKLSDQEQLAYSERDIKFLKGETYR